MVLALAAWPIAAPVSAEGPVHATLHWEGGDGCIDASTLQAAVATHLGREVFVDEGAEVVVSGVASISSGEVVIRLVMSSLDGTTLGTRTLRMPGSDCRALDDDVAIVIALMIDLPREEIDLFVPPPTAELPSAAPSEEATTAAPEGAATAREDRVRLAMSASAVGAFQLLPGVHGGARVGAEIDPLGILPLEIGLTLWLPVSTEIDGGGATFLAWSVLVGGCALAHFEPITLGGCAGVELGAIHATGFGLDEKLEPVRPLVMAEAMGQAGVLLGEVLELRVRVGVAVPFIRDRFLYEQAGLLVVLHQSEIILPIAEVGLAVHFDS
jgi:hypothetical protein